MNFLAGKLAADDLPFVRDTGADVAGVRGAACEGGRTGRVSADKVPSFVDENLAAWGRHSARSSTTLGEQSGRWGEEWSVKWQDNHRSHTAGATQLPGESCTR